MYYILRYESAKAKYIDAQDAYRRLVDKKDELFQRTQPQAIEIKPDKISGGGASNPLEEYMIAKDRLGVDDRIVEARNILQERVQLLEVAERDLRQSPALYDRVYVMRYLSAHSVDYIARSLHYSKRQVYNIINTIAEKSAQNFTKAGV